jgi:hypothetical protein
VDRMFSCFCHSGQLPEHRQHRRIQPGPRCKVPNGSWPRIRTRPPTRHRRRGRGCLGREDVGGRAQCPRGCLYCLSATRRALFCSRCPANRL